MLLLYLDFSKNQCLASGGHFLIFIRGVIATGNHWIIDSLRVAQHDKKVAKEPRIGDNPLRVYAYAVFATFQTATLRIRGFSPMYPLRIAGSADRVLRVMV